MARATTKKSTAKKATGKKKSASKAKKAPAKKAAGKKGKFSHGKFLADAGKIGTAVHNDGAKLIDAVGSVVAAGNSMIASIMVLREHFEVNANNLVNMSVEEKEAVLTGIIQTLGEVFDNIGEVLNAKR